LGIIVRIGDIIFTLSHHKKKIEGKVSVNSKMIRADMINPNSNTYFDNWVKRDLDFVKME